MTEQDRTGCVITDRGSLMQVGSGRIFYPLDPRPEEVDIRDIAKSLSRIIRFNGHSDIAINVANHSFNCAYLVWRFENEDDVDLMRYMLLHDAAEAYVGDMIRPLKIEMPAYQEAEHTVWECIVEALDIKPVDMAAVKYYDNVACAWEKRDLFTSAMEWTGMPDITKLHLETLIPASAESSEQAFLTTYRVLSNESNPPPQH